MDKTVLVSTVKHRLSEKIRGLQHLIDETRASNNDTKSSMGDKYETGREMIQQEINTLQRQLNESLAQEDSIKKLNAEKCTEAKSGALVETDRGFFYLATSVGEMMHDGKKIHTVSMESPIAKAMFGKKKDEVFTLNQTAQTIRNIW